MGVNYFDLKVSRITFSRPIFRALASRSNMLCEIGQCSGIREHPEMSLHPI